MRNDVGNNEWVIRDRSGGAFQKRSRISGALGLTTRVRRSHTCPSALSGHLLAALSFGSCHRLIRRDAIQQWRSKQYKRQQPNAEFAQHNH
jgi:hypothetical protein